ncbi:chemotaxis protein CheW [Bosea sp. (in: a-proteobacteria)]|uniref:chemotaxis protein CheW n=1 Tax=Bosea sp. (in: a-proteobacteria) TaxID=1871050 RepID=UPI001221348B|nr:chemotaxis protein CheW [Bosea sp. (in: a-proteobacteria)]TAJ28506.1 MAG: chemotaxis protein CheW [Bosea sp. (in: a-proteobacteria)]
MTLRSDDSDTVPGQFEASLDYVTVRIEKQLLGLPIGRVRDVFMTNRITIVPGSPADIVGLLNLRGRVVTALCLRRRLGYPPPPRFQKGTELTAVGLDHQGEAYALIVDSVGEVMRLDHGTLEPLPGHLDRSWSALATGVHRLPDQLLVILDLDAVLDLDLQAAA